MYKLWQGKSIVETQREDEATQNAGNNVVKCQEQIVTACDGLQTMQEMQ
jgi:hypothetical protein